MIKSYPSFSGITKPQNNQIDKARMAVQVKVMKK